jgi:hypothetical protein
LRIHVSSHQDAYINLHIGQLNTCPCSFLRAILAVVVP